MESGLWVKVDIVYDGECIGRGEAASVEEAMRAAVENGQEFLAEHPPVLAAVMTRVLREDTSI